ncbi:MAG: hypothetical protein AVDCRST_MAG18-1173, partial [uncultured Thermomicrobiales bacterium]
GRGRAVARLVAHARVVGRAADDRRRLRYPHVPRAAWPQPAATPAGRVGEGGAGAYPPRGRHFCALGPRPVGRDRAGPRGDRQRGQRRDAPHPAALARRARRRPPYRPGPRPRGTGAQHPGARPPRLRGESLRALRRLRAQPSAPQPLAGWDNPLQPRLPDRQAPRPVLFVRRAARRRDDRAGVGLFSV